MNLRPKVSVCMAAYQGERYIALQLGSILEQLSASDEAVVVDDASTDDTSAIVAAMGDPRIVLLHNSRNLGVLRSFEIALSRASGGIIFLSDQDDVWLPGKVASVLNKFEHNPEVTLVASDANLIDESGATTGPSFYQQRGRFNAGVWSNVMIGKFHGCTMAFRKDLLRTVLPFPRCGELHHDTWIGCVNTLIGGTTQYISAPLVAYRRHSTNVTGRVRFGTYRRLKIRLPLVFGLLRIGLRRLVRATALFVQRIRALLLGLHVRGPRE